jgi:hypothetical protein
MVCPTRSPDGSYPLRRWKRTPCPPRLPLSYHTLGAALMKALRFAASVLIIAAILALYRTLLPVNNTTVALTLLRSG